MQYKSIEHVPEQHLNRAQAYMGAVTRLSNSRTAARIAQYILHECLLSGTCELSHKEFERRTKSCRRTVQRSIHSLLRNELILRIGTTESGHAIYQCIFERADEHVEWGKIFDRDWDSAKKAGKLKDFTAPTYPSPRGNADAE